MFSIKSAAQSVPPAASTTTVSPEAPSLRRRCPTVPAKSAFSSVHWSTNHPGIRVCEELPPTPIEAACVSHEGKDTTFGRQQHPDRHRMFVFTMSASDLCFWMARSGKSLEWLRKEIVHNMCVSLRYQVSSHDHLPESMVRNRLQINGMPNYAQRLSHNKKDVLFTTLFTSYECKRSRVKRSTAKRHEEASGESVTTWPFVTTRRPPAPVHVRVDVVILRK